MAQIPIGRILPIFKGNWNSSTTYVKLDIVYYNGSSYVAKSTNTNQTPSDNSFYWQIVAKASTWTDFSDAEKAEVIAYLETVVQPIFDELEGDIDALGDRVTAAEGDIDALEISVNQLELEDEKLNALNNRNIGTNLWENNFDGKIINDNGTITNNSRYNTCLLKMTNGYTYIINNQYKKNGDSYDWQPLKIFKYEDNAYSLFFYLPSRRQHVYTCPSDDKEYYIMSTFDNGQTVKANDIMPTIYNVSGTDSLLNKLWTKDSPKIFNQRGLSSISNYLAYIDGIKEIYCPLERKSNLNYWIKIYGNKLYFTISYTNSSHSQSNIVQYQPSISSIADGGVLAINAPNDVSEAGIVGGQKVLYVIFKKKSLFTDFNDTALGTLLDDDVFNLYNSDNIREYLNPYVIPDGSITTAKIADDAVITSKIADANVTKAKLSTAVQSKIDAVVTENIMGGENYKNDFYEIFVNDTFAKDTTRISLKYHNNYLYLKGWNANVSTSTPLWIVRKTITSAVNDVVYEIPCSTTNVAYISTGDVGVYVVFKDVVNLRNNDNDGDGININKDRALKTYMNMRITMYITPTANIADGAVTEPKTTFFDQVSDSPNLCNPDEISEEGYYINTDSGKKRPKTAGLTDLRYCTGYIPITTKGLICNKDVAGGSVVGMAYYSSKSEDGFLEGRKNSGFIPYVEGAVYVRLTLSSSTEVMVNKGSTQLEYVPYSNVTHPVLKENLLPEIDTDKIVDEAITMDKLSTEVQEAIGGVEQIQINLPTNMRVKVGDTIRIYWRSIIQAPDPYIYDVYAVDGGVGHSFPRYYEYKAASVRTLNVTVYVKNANGDILAQKSTSIRSYNTMSQPSSNINVLVMGASATAKGYIAGELRRRLTTNSGDGTTQNPTGINLSGINFVGRLTGSIVTDVHQEATGGWSWKDYATNTRDRSYRFYVTGVTSINIGDKYTINSLTFTVRETNIDPDDTGNISCDKIGSGDPPLTGTLTRVEGEGDLTISYGAYLKESSNPFWNANENRLDFTSYANEYCNGSIDLFISHCGVNDVFNAVYNYTTTDFHNTIESYIKPFVRQFHSEFQNAKFVFSTIPLAAPFGFGDHYAANAQWNYYTFARKAWNIADCAREMAADPEFSSYFYVAEVLPLFDAENLYSTTTKVVTLRNATKTETIQTNPVHPIQIGSLTVADAIFEQLNFIYQ